MAAKPRLYHESCTCWSAIFVAICPAFVVGKGLFLGTSDRHHALAPTNGGQSTLLLDLETAIGRDQRFATERRVSRLEEAMRPTFNALPKDEFGRLGASGVSYMLHRLFVQRHGWFVSGFDVTGDSWNSSSPADLIGAHISQDVQGVFDKQLKKHGFDLHHAAVLAATLEEFVHVEAVERLESAYKLVGLSPNDKDASESSVAQAMKTYMMMYVLQKNHSNATRRWMKAAFKKIDVIYPTWNVTVGFLEEIQKSVLEGDTDGAGATLPLSWNTTLKILETFGERYGRWQSRECMSMKRKLVEMEDPNTGRVPLSRFYGGHTSDEDWLFMESVEYLRSLGVLDDSDPARPSVMIPNYLNGPNNCVAGSKFYDVCCIDECEALVSHLEKHIVASEASPQRILDLVAALPSDTVSAPRKLPNALTQRLKEIADHHNGLVPLHGRLFAQWMHHAYPRECAYPHLSGTVNLMSPQEFMRTGADIIVSPERRASLLSDDADGSRTSDDGEERVLPWTSEEELFVCRSGGHDVEASQERYGSHAIRYVVMLLFSGMMVLVRLHPKGNAGLKGTSFDDLSHKYYV